MILVDTSVWVDHLRFGDETLAGLLETGHVLVHPFVVGELALGNLRQRQAILDYLRDLPQVEVATYDEVLQFVERRGLAGQGIGYVDAHLLASTQLSSGSSLWTRDIRLSAVAAQFRLASKLPTAAVRIVGSAAITASQGSCPPEPRQPPDRTNDRCIFGLSP